ncbi:MAG TPA: WD40 repeat domain-containing protein [Caulifigura sp.]|nr:WD40 repeat domain-containing protein [Caulifigura sp.]
MKLRVIWGIGIVVLLLAAAFVAQKSLTGGRPQPPATNVASAKRLSDAVAAQADAKAKQDAVASGLRGAPIYTRAKRSVAISPDGKQLAAGNGDGVIDVWNVPEKKLQLRFKAHTDWAFDLAYTPGGMLVSGGGDNLVKLFDPATGKLLRGFAHHDNDLHGVAVTPGGEWLISSGDDAVVYAKSLKEDALRKLGKHEAQVTSVAVSPDGKLAVSTSRDMTASIWDLDRMTLKTALRGHTADVMSAAFSPDSQRVVTCGYDKTIRVWNISVEPPEPVYQVDDLPDWMFAVTFSSSGNRIYAGGGKGSLVVYDPATKKLAMTIMDGDVSDLALSADGRQLAVVTSKGGLHLVPIDPESGELGTAVTFVLPASDPLVQVGPPLSAREYVDRHDSIMSPGDTWGEELAVLAPFADPFTAEILRGVSDENLRYDQRELKQRVLTQLWNRRQDTGPTLRPDEIRPMLERVAVAEECCERVHAKLEAWLVARLRSQASEAKTLDQLKTLRAEDSIGSPELARRIHKYIDLILQPPAAAAETPAPQPTN